MFGIRLFASSKISSVGQDPSTQTVKGNPWRNPWLRVSELIPYSWDTKNQLAVLFLIQNRTQKKLNRASRYRTIKVEHEKEHAPHLLHTLVSLHVSFNVSLFMQVFPFVAISTPSFWLLSTLLWVKPHHSFKHWHKHCLPIQFSDRATCLYLKYLWEAPSQLLFYTHWWVDWHIGRSFHKSEMPIHGKEPQERTGERKPTPNRTQGKNINTKIK